MDRQLPTDLIRKRRARAVAGVAASVLVLLAGVWALRAAISPSLDRSRIRTSIAELGPVDATVSASGTVVPEYEQVITSPIASTVIAVLHRAGDTIKTGESILGLDTESLALSLQEHKDELAMQQNRKRQLMLEAEQKKIDLQSSYEIKQLQTQFAGAQYNRIKHLHDIGGTTQEELDRASLQADIAQRELEHLKRQVDNQQASLQSELRSVDLEISVRRGRVTQTGRQLELAEIRAQRNGVVTWVNDNLGSSVGPGEVVARIADLDSYKIEARISDVHADKLTVGGPVMLRIGRKEMTGRINSIHPAVESGIAVFDVELETAESMQLRPNLRADVFVITSRADNVVRVKNGPFYSGVADQRVFVIRGDKALARKVDIGASNIDWVELRGDVAPGEEVVISDMRKYEHLEEIAVRAD